VQLLLLAKENLPRLTDEPGLTESIYAPPIDPEWERAWRITERIILEMAKEVDRQNARFLVVTLSEGDQVHPDPRLRERRCETLGVPDLFYPEQRIGEWAKRSGIEVYCLAPPMLEYVDSTGTFLHGFERNLGFGHWNEAGHTLAAELMADYLQTEPVPPSHPAGEEKTIPADGAR